MKAGLLICDHVRPELFRIQGNYLNMFQKLLPELELIPYYVCDGQFPESVNEQEIYLTTGSGFSVYEDVPWIQKLTVFVKDIYKANKLFIGICFGHQMMAHALGGKVEKPESGWCIGIHKFEVFDRQSWMLPPKNKINLLMMCQDQIIQLPPNGKVFAKTELCPVGIFTMGETFLGIQAHPEFSILYDQGLYNIRRKLIGVETIKEADKTLSEPLHTDLIARWIMNFIGKR